MNKNRHLFYLLLGALCTSCSSFLDPVIDPCAKREVACLREEMWLPPPLAKEALEVLPELAADCHPWTPAELIDVALQNNPLTLRTWADARAAAFNWEASKSQLYPSVNLQESLNFTVTKVKNSDSDSTVASTTGNTVSPSNINPTSGNGSSASGGIGYNQRVIHNLSASYLLLDFGGRSASIEAARHALYASNWIHNRSIQDVIVNVLRAYYTYQQAFGLYQAELLNLQDAKVSLDSAVAQFEAGVKTHLDVLQAKTAYVNIQLALDQALGNVKSGMGALAAAIGTPANTTYEIEPLPEILPIEQVTHNMEELLEYAKSSRGDLAAAYASYRQTVSNWKVARSAGLPIITANADYEWVNNIHYPSQNFSFRSGSIALQVPIFSGFLYVNQEKQAAANVESSFADLQQAESNVLLDVVTAYYAFQTAGTAVKFSQEYLQYAEQAYEGISIGYREGTNTITDLLTLQMTVSNARAQLVQARSGWLISLANLAYAAGSLYDCNG